MITKMKETKHTKKAHKRTSTRARVCTDTHACTRAHPAKLNAAITAQYQVVKGCKSTSLHTQHRAEPCSEVQNCAYLSLLLAATKQGQNVLMLHPRMHGVLVVSLQSRGQRMKCFSPSLRRPRVFTEQVAGSGHSVRQFKVGGHGRRCIVSLMHSKYLMKGTRRNENRHRA